MFLLFAEKLTVRERKKVQERFGEPDSKLKASTISGDIKVRDC